MEKNIHMARTGYFIDILAAITRGINIYKSNCELCRWIGTRIGSVFNTQSLKQFVEMEPINNSSYENNTYNIKYMTLSF